MGEKRLGSEPAQGFGEKSKKEDRQINLGLSIKNSPEQLICYNVGVWFVVSNPNVLCRKYKPNFVIICFLLEDQQWKSHSLVESS